MDGDGAQSDDDDFLDDDDDDFEPEVPLGQFTLTLTGFKRPKQDDDANNQSPSVVITTLKEMATDKVKHMLYDMVKSNTELLAKVAGMKDTYMYDS